MPTALQRRMRQYEHQPDTAKKQLRLLFIGKHYPNFVEEARKYGISRNVPLKALANLTWGDEILCAQYQSAGIKEPKYESNLDGTRTQIGERTKNLGQANLLCSFTLRDIYVREPSIAAHLQNELYLDGLVAAWDHCMSDCTPIARGCGSYTIGERAIMRAPMSRIYEELRKITEKLKGVTDKNGHLLNRKLHIMIGGPLCKVFEPGIFINPIKFSRNLIDIPAGTDYGQDYEELHYRSPEEAMDESLNNYIVAIKKYGKTAYNQSLS
jgi:hypothetical protein